MSETDVLTGGATIEEAADTRSKRRPLPSRCYACEAPVTGPYCCACGQRNDDCRRSVFSLVGETLRDVSSLEGRFVRTLRAVLTRPGRYVRAYGDGERSPYSPPVRFFLVVSFAFFTTLWLTDRQIVTLQPVVELDEAGELRLDEFVGGFFAKPIEVRYPPEVREKMREAMLNDTGERGVDALTEAAETEIAEVLADAEDDAADALAEEDAEAAAAIQEEAEAEVATIREALAEDVAEIEAALAQAEAVRAEAYDAGYEIGRRARAITGGGADEPARSDAYDAGEAPGERVREVRGGGPGTKEGHVPEENGTQIGSYQEDGVRLGVHEGSDGTIMLNGRKLDRQRFTDALFRVAENPRAFNNALGDWIPRIMLLMVPLMALCGAVFIRGRDALLYDHALLSLNTHAVAFIAMTLGLWTSALLPGWLFAGIVLLGVPIYYAKGLRGAFRRSRRKTVAATAFVFSVYGLVLTTALSAAAVTAFADTL